MLESPILYEYALDARGIPRHIKDSNSVSPYKCGDCNGEMIAKKGDVRRWHFAHKARVICNPKSDPDNALHRYAQEIVIKAFNRNKESRTEYSTRVRCTGFNTDACDGISENYNIAIPGSELHKELSIIPGTRSDLVLINADEPRAILEVVNTHPLDTETQKRYKESEVPVYIRNLEWSTLHELSSEFVADDHLNIGAQPLCDQCAQKKESFKAKRKRKLAQEAERRKKYEEKQQRRIRIIDRAVERIVRTPCRKPQFRPWYKVKKESWGGHEIIMYPKTQYPVFANAIILTQLGFNQHNPEKPWLFSFRIHKDGKYIYADLGGSDVVPIYEDTAAMLYAPDLSDDCEIEICAVNQFAEILQSHGVDVRVGFLAGYEIDRQHVNPMKHIDKAMLNGLVKWVEKSEKTERQQARNEDQDWRTTDHDRMQILLRQRQLEGAREPQQTQDEDVEAWRRLNDSLRRAKGKTQAEQK